MTRVEGEGSLRLVVRDGVVVESHLAIFEAPRYFERLVVGRTPDEVLDIVARICGICPVAYQMSAVHAFEDLAGVDDRSRRCARCAASSTAANGSRATRSTSTCSMPPTSSAARTSSSSPPSTGRPSSAAWPSRRSATTSSRSSAAGRSTRSASASAASRACPRARSSSPCGATLDGALARREATVDWVATFDGARVRARRALRRPAAPERVPDERRAGSSRPTASTSPRPTGARPSPRSRSPGRTRSRRDMADRVPYLLGPAARVTLTARPAASRGPRGARSDRARRTRSRATRTGASRRGPSSSSTRWPRRSTSSTPTCRRTARPSRGAAGPAWPPGRPRRRAASCSIATSSTSAGRDRPRRSSRRRARTRSPSRPTSPTFAPSILDRAARRRDPPARAADPQLRPVHLVRDALPRPAHRARPGRGDDPMTSPPPGPDRPDHGLRQRGPGRRRGRGRGPVATLLPTLPRGPARQARGAPLRGAARRRPRRPAGRRVLPGRRRGRRPRARPVVRCTLADLAKRPDLHPAFVAPAADRHRPRARRRSCARGRSRARSSVSPVTGSGTDRRCRGPCARRSPVFPTRSRPSSRAWPCHTGRRPVAPRHGGEA